MEYKKEVKIKVTAIKCDYCEKEQILNDKFPMVYIYSCGKCQKDMCNDHVGQATEDGHLCIECAKRYEIEYAEEGGVGIRDIQTGEWVEEHL